MNIRLKSRSRFGRPMPRVVHFEMAADDVQRCQKFYQNVFGWKLMKWEGPTEYWLISTGEEKEQGIDGGLAKREDSPFDQSVTNTIDVRSVEEAIKNVEANGGAVLMPKSPVPGVGWLAYFKDTEGNIFGMMEQDESAQ